MLAVEHIIVCGHYGCGGILAASSLTQFGLIDNWLRHIQDTAHLYSHLLNKIDDAETRVNKLCQLLQFRTHRLIAGNESMRAELELRQGPIIQRIVIRSEDVIT